MMSVAHQLQTALLFANLMKRNVKSPDKMRMDAQSPLHVLFKSVTTTETFAQYTVLENVTMAKSNVQEKEMTLDAKDLHSASHCPKNYGVMM